MSQKKPWIVAHRGGRSFGPENTKRALENGIQMDADAVEFDIRVTKDHIPVLFHDKTIKRTTNRKENIEVSDLLLHELKELDLGSWYSHAFEGESILTLEDALSMIEGRKPALVEIKDVDIEDIQYITDIIIQHPIHKTSYIMSFHKEVLFKVKELQPSLQTVYLIHKDYQTMKTDIEHPDFNHIGFGRRLALKMKTYFKVIHQLEKQVFVYTVNDARSAITLYNHDVDVLISDNPIKIEHALSKQK